MVHTYTSKTKSCYDANFVVTGGSATSDNKFGILTTLALHWRHNGHDSVSNHQPHDCLLNREFPAQMASNAENVSIWWRHHGWQIWHHNNS